MRTELKKSLEKRGTIRATFERFGTKVSYGHPKPTALFLDLKFADGSFAADHIWFTVGKQIEEMSFSQGDIVEFEARVKRYVKGYYGSQSYDYKLSHPTKFRKIQVHQEGDYTITFKHSAEAIKFLNPNYPEPK